MNKKYHGITWANSTTDEEQDDIINKWKKMDLCSNNIHLFDEVLSIENHYLHCDVCGLEVHIEKIVKGE